MRDQTFLVAAFAILAFVIVGCRAERPSTGSVTQLENELRALVDAAVRDHPNLPAVALAVDAPRLGLEWKGAAGVADPASGAPMTPDHPVLVASNTKTFVAAAILRLWELGRLELDDPIADHLPAELVDLLLGEVVERAAGKPLPAAVRELVGFERLGLSSTWWDLLESPPAGVPERAHQLTGDLDSYAVDPSIDLYGGGGIVATMGDLARFMRALFTGRVFANAATVETMLTTIAGASAGPGEPGPKTIPDVYRMGVFVVDVDGTTVWQHSGYWGTIAGYVPSLDVAFAAVITQRDARALLGELESEVLALVRTADGERAKAGGR